ncbi:peter pan-related [Holotrichia oblita]|uniref:Peter pan-related n=1 Tax=Holotrichia oblita TaxID=644536 RepID=A0ACB9SQJ2_HOLOL|nr:peter pan-related [Holotrichia oblita]
MGKRKRGKGRCVRKNTNVHTEPEEYVYRKGVKKVVQGKIPDLSRCNDISDLLTEIWITVESLNGRRSKFSCHFRTKDYIPRKRRTGEISVRLTELGPRLTLQLIKIEDGLMDGEVLYHDLIFKSEEEKEEIQKKRELKRTLKWKRKRIQNENQKKKEAIKQELKEKSLKGMRKNETETDRLLKKTAEEARIEEQDDDVEYYKEEVGEAPDRDLFTNSQKTGTKRPPKTFHNYKNKRIKLDRSDGDKIVGRAFRINKRIAKKGGVDKTNSRNRDFRPIGGANLKGGVRKFKSTGRKLNSRNKLC